MAKPEKTYMLVVAQNTLIVPVPPGEVGGDMELSDAEIEELFGDPNHGSDWCMVVAPSDDVPTLATFVEVTGRAGYTAYTHGKHFVTVSKHIRRKGILRAKPVPVKRPPFNAKTSEVDALKADFVRYVQSNPKGLKIFMIESVLKKVNAMTASDQLVLWLLALTPVPHEERMRLAPLAATAQVRGLRAWLNSPDRQADVKQVRALTAEDQTFLNAILESPESDAPRLRYADWLDQQADPRGRFIRLQCKRAKIKTYNRQKADLEKQERALLDEYEKDWLGPLPQLRCGFVLQRGFPMPFKGLFVDEFLNHGQRVFNSCPLQSLTIVNQFERGSRKEQLRAIAASLLLRRLNRLGFTIEGLVDRRAPGGYNATGLGIGDDGVKIVAASPHLAGLKILDLRENEIGDTGAKTLASSPHLAALVELDLSGNPIGLKGAQALAASKTLVNLKKLNMKGTKIEADAAKMLRAHFGNCAR